MEALFEKIAILVAQTMRFAKLSFLPSFRKQSSCSRQPNIYFTKEMRFHRPMEPHPFLTVAEFHHDA